VAIDPPPLGLVTLSTLSLNLVRGVRARREFAAQLRARAAAGSGTAGLPGPSRKAENS